MTTPYFPIVMVCNYRVLIITVRYSLLQDYGIKSCSTFDEIYYTIEYTYLAKGITMYITKNNFIFFPQIVFTLSIALCLETQGSDICEQRIALWQNLLLWIVWW